MTGFIWSFPKMTSRLDLYLELSMESLPQHREFYAGGMDFTWEENLVKEETESGNNYFCYIKDVRSGVDICTC